MKERPILFSGEMVRAILDGRKTMTRRVIKVQPPDDAYILGRMVESTARADRKNEGKLHWIKFNDSRIISSDKTYFKCPYGQIGDMLWVRETYIEDTNGIHYKADDKFNCAKELGGWTPSIFMFREYSRINLEITNIRVERLSDITEEDAKAEGVAKEGNTVYPYSFKEMFSHLWDSINSKRGFGWDKNPWVWVIEFRRV